MSSYITFTDRATYLAARAAWRAEYAALSERIRDLRVSIKDKSREGPDWAAADDMMEKARLRVTAMRLMATRTHMTKMMREQVEAECAAKEAA